MPYQRSLSLVNEQYNKIIQAIVEFWWNLECKHLLSNLNDRIIFKEIS